MPRRKDRPKITGKGFVIVDMDNPMYSSDHPEGPTNPRTIKAAYNLTQSPPMFMYVKGKIDKAQYEAAVEFGKL